jgi:Cof subfamily protein (haloacid dehalogenase superfamily)
MIPQYRMICFDLDGTALDPNHQITPRLLSVFHEIEKKNGIIVPATGRVIQSIRPYAEQHGWTGWSILYNGAVLYHLGSGTIEILFSLAPQIVLMILETMQAFPELAIQVYHRGKQGVFRDNEFSRKLASDEFLTFHLIQDLDEIIHYWNKETIIKMVVCGPRESQDKLDKAFADTNLNIRFIPSGGSCYRDILHSQTNKGMGMQKLIEKFNINLREVVAAGDNLNDLEMLQCAGYSIAMGNGHDELKRIASVVTLSNAEDGLAVALHNLLNKLPLT